MADHDHADYATVSNVICQNCGKHWEVCAYCDESWHKCEVDTRLLPGYRLVPGFPDYMVNKQATVRHIKSQRYCMLMRVTKEGGAMISLLRDGKKYTKAAQELRDLAFNGSEKATD